MDEQNLVRMLTIVFSGKISQVEVPFFRGSVLNAMGGEADILYHNHDGDTKYRYSYPLIQYKRINGKAAIVCLNEGTEVIGQFFLSGKTDFRIGNHDMQMTLENLAQDAVPLVVTDAKYRYTIHNWLALNTQNYKLYTEKETLVEKITFLEGILKANLLSFAKGLGVNIEEQIDVAFCKMSEPRSVINKNTRLLAFDVDFISNMLIPDNIGLGKNASIGYGVVKSA